MLHVLTLGGLTLESSENSLVAAHVRLQGLGLLARLAVAGERGVSREKLIGCFWPDKEERVALHSLSQALHRLKSDLGSESLLFGTRVLRLNPDQITSDVAEIEDALRAHDNRKVVEIYAGPFLDGIYFTCAPEFERWVESERRRLAELYAGALRRLATSAAAAGDHADAASCWQRLLALDPLDDRVALQLVESLAAAGEDGAARREARFHQSLIRTELHVEPDSRFAAYTGHHSARGDERAPSGREAAPECKGSVQGADDLTVDELCARGRQCFLTFTTEGFTEGIRYAERAIQRDPRHAQAHVTLGWLCIVLSQATQAGNPRARGVAHVRRAAELDSTLADVPLALALAAEHEGRFDEADGLARKSIAMDPANPFAHFIHGWVCLNHGLRSGRHDRCVAGVASLCASLQRYARDPLALMALSCLYVASCQYDAARQLLERVVAMERDPAGEIPMIAGLTLLGIVHSRSGRVLDARACLDEASTAYQYAPQIFAPYVNALTLVAIGDLERQAGRYDESVSYYARARTMLEPMPDLIGCGYLLVRLELRLAAAFRRLRMRPEEEQHAGAARRLTEVREVYSFHWCWGTSEAELHYDWAVYHATCVRLEAMCASLRKAISLGWREAALLESESAFAFCSGERTVRALAGAALARPPLPEPALAFS